MQNKIFARMLETWALWLWNFSLLKQHWTGFVVETVQRFTFNLISSPEPAFISRGWVNEVSHERGVVPLRHLRAGRTGCRCVPGWPEHSKCSAEDSLFNVQSASVKEGLCCQGASEQAVDYRGSFNESLSKGSPFYQWLRAFLAHLGAGRDFLPRGRPTTHSSYIVASNTPLFVFTYYILLIWFSAPRVLNVCHWKQQDNVCWVLLGLFLSARNALMS